MIKYKDHVMEQLWPEQTVHSHAEMDKLLADEQSWTNCWQKSRAEQTAGRQTELYKLQADE